MEISTPTTNRSGYFLVHLHSLVIDHLRRMRALLPRKLIATASAG